MQILLIFYFRMPERFRLVLEGDYPGSSRGYTREAMKAKRVLANRTNPDVTIPSAIEAKTPDNFTLVPGKAHWTGISREDVQTNEIAPAVRKFIQDCEASELGLDSFCMEIMAVRLLKRGSVRYPLSECPREGHKTITEAFPHSDEVKKAFDNLLRLKFMRSTGWAVEKVGDFRLALGKVEAAAQGQ